MSRPDRPALYDRNGRRSWDELVREMATSREVDPGELDLSVSSLRAVWRSVMPRLQPRPTGQPVDEAVQPPWWSGPSWRRYAAWDDVSHSRISAVAYRLRQVLLAQPGTTAGLGEAGTVDAGEPVVVFADRPDVNPLREVKSALADVWDGRADPDALARVVDLRPAALPPELLYPTRLVLRLRAPAGGVLRRRRDLDTSTLADGLCELLQQAVEQPTAGEARTEYHGTGDPRALVTMRGDRQRLREVEVVLGAPRDEPVASARGAVVREVVHGLLALAARTGAEVEVVEAVRDHQHAPRPTGRLSTSTLEHVLRAVGL